MPWADALYAADAMWWRTYGPRLSWFRGLRLSIHPEADRLGYMVRSVPAAPGRPMTMHFGADGGIGWGGNSGFQAVNLAAQFGCRRIVLVGFDMRVDFGVHWHGNHPGRMNNPTEARVRKWAQRMDAAAADLAEFGVTVINASEISALLAYPKMKFEEAVACFEV